MDRTLFDQPLRIELLGRLCVLQGERILARFRTQKTGLLLACLSLFPDRAHPREEMLERLWPEVEPEAGRLRLRVELNSLRRQLEPPGIPPGSILLADRLHIRLHRAAIITDVLTFESALQTARASGPEEEVRHLAEAVQVYRGELLPGFYDEWVLSERERLADAYRGAIRRLVSALEATGDLDRAIDYAHRAVGADPYQEEAHYDLMRLYSAASHPSDALRQYREMERLLREGLETSPSTEARELAEALALLVEKVTVPRRLAPISPIQQEPGPTTLCPTPSASAPQKQTDEDIGASAIHLPLQFTRFFGREEELSRLQDLLSREFLLAPSRIVTLTGAGGSGKTRLAIEAARRAAVAFPGGIWFVPLADLTDASWLPDAIVDALGLPRSPQQDPLEQVMEFLNGSGVGRKAWGVRTAPRSPSLLVLDNFEHLTAVGAPTVLRLLERVEGLTCLITSRQVLNLEGEQEFPVLPLPVPEEKRKSRDERPESESLSPAASRLATLLSCPSVALFVDRAQARRVDFQVTERNAGAVAALCERLEGLPLSIELAAAWARMLTPAQMLERLAHRFDLLISRRKELPSRHLSLQAALDWSYDLLPSDLQRLFARLSVFLGGWTEEAAQAVCFPLAQHQENGTADEGHALHYLAQLRERSLILAEERGGVMRYRMLETLREFGWERLSPEERTTLHLRHLAYMLGVAERERQGRPGGFIGWLHPVEEEYDNIRAALDWYEMQGSETDAGWRLAAALAEFWLQRGHHREGRERLERAVERAACTAPSAPLAGLYRGAGLLAGWSGDYAAAHVHLQKALETLLAIGDKNYAAHVMSNLGLIIHWQGDLETARATYEESLALARALGDRGRTGLALCLLGELATEQGDYAHARACLEECLERCVPPGERGGVCDSLGDLAFAQGDYAEARRFWTVNLIGYQEDGNRVGVTAQLHRFGRLAMAQNQPIKAVRLYAAAESLHETSGAVLRPADRQKRDEAISIARAALAEDACAAAWAEGCAMTPEQAIVYALEDEAVR